MLAAFAVDPQPWCAAPEVGEGGGRGLWSVPGHGTQHGLVRGASPATRAGCPAGTMPLHREAVPEFCFIVPSSPIPAKAVPAGDGWVHEVKFDGYRVQVHKLGSKVVLYSRNGHDFTDRFPSIAQLLRAGQSGSARRR